MLAAQSDITDEDDLYEFYNNPTEYLLGNKVKKVVVIHPESQELQGSSFTPAQNDRFIFSSKFEHTNDICKCYGGFSLELSNLWKFKIYQDQTKVRQNKIRYEIKNKLGLDELDFKSLLSNKGLVKKLKEIHRAEKCGVNQSSLVLLHHPTINARINPRCFRKCIHFDFKCPRYRRGQFDYFHTATLLTGDINLKELRNDANDFVEFVECEKEIGVFLIPHHGSQHNTSVDVVKRVAGESFALVCSYGRTNQFHHPNAYLLNKLAEQLYAPVWHVSSEEDLSYYISKFPE